VKAEVVAYALHLVPASEETQAMVVKTMLLPGAASLGVDVKAARNIADQLAARGYIEPVARKKDG
jgi:hypothetical protein